MTGTGIVITTNVSTTTISKSLATGITLTITIAITSVGSAIQIAIAIGMTLDSAKVTSLTAICAGMRMPRRRNLSEDLGPPHEAGVTS